MDVECGCLNLVSHSINLPDLAGLLTGASTFLIQGNHMKRFLLAMMAVLWVTAVSAQAPVKLCFQTGTLTGGKTSCQDVTTANPLPVTPLNVAVTNALALSTTGGWTLSLVNNLLTTTTAIKNSAGQIGSIYCYNPSQALAFVQTFNLTPGQVTLGVTSPTNSYGISATNTLNFSRGPIGDQYTSAISIAATTTATGLTPPATGLNCNVSFN